MPNKLVRCGLHLELQKFGRQIDLVRPELKDVVKSNSVLKAAQQHGIERMGIELSYAQSRALFAVQTLLDENEYIGNTGSIVLPNSNPYLFCNDLPRVLVSPGDYLHAYDLVKKKSGRGKMEFNSEGRKIALKALQDLSEKRFLLVYEKRDYDANGKVKQKHLVEAVAPLIALGKVKGQLLITPNPILVDQIDTYFVWKPTGLYNRVLDGKSRTKALFIEQLLFWFEMNRRDRGKPTFILTRQMYVMAHALRMDALLEARQDVRIRKLLIELYEYAVEIRYLKGFEVDVPGAKAKRIDRLHLNSATFKLMRSV